MSQVCEPQHRFPAVDEGLAHAVRRVETLVGAEPGEDYTAQLLASAAGVSVRSLFRAFRRLRGHGPMEAVRRARLACVRRDLLAAGPRDSVTDIAMRWGFFHLGRFAGVYCDRFGELPSVTRRRARDVGKAA